MTGTRLVPLDRRRARGVRGKLGKTLVNGLNNGPEPQQRWTHFSSALDRQAVGEALDALPNQQRQVVKLAYFGGLTNREIADHLGVPVGAVRRRLRQALVTAGEYVERGQAAGYKVVCVLAAWLCGRSFETSGRSLGAGVHQMVRASIVVAAGVTASAALGTAYSQSQPTPIEQASVPAVQATQTSAAPAPAPATTTVAVGGNLKQIPVKSDELQQAPALASIPVKVTVPGRGRQDANNVAAGVLSLVPVTPVHGHSVDHGHGVIAGLDQVGQHGVP